MPTQKCILQAPDLLDIEIYPLPMYDNGQFTGVVAPTISYEYDDGNYKFWSIAKDWENGDAHDATMENYIAYCGGASHNYSPWTGTGNSEGMCFFFGLKCTASNVSNTFSGSAIIYMGQGVSGINLLWYLGCPDCAISGKSATITINNNIPCCNFSALRQPISGDKSHLTLELGYVNS